MEREGQSTTMGAKERVRAFKADGWDANSHVLIFPCLLISGRLEVSPLHGLFPR